MTRVAAVVIGLNEGPRLTRCLRSVLGRFDPVVYVDSESTDGSIAAAQELGADVITLDLSTPFTFGRARNAGTARVLELAPNVDYVQFIDADSELVASWVEHGARAMEAEPRIAAVHGRVRERNPGSTIYDRLFELEFDPRAEDDEVFGGMAMLRIAALRQCGGFPETVRAFEDHELGFHLRRAGWQTRRLDCDMAIHEAGFTRWRDWWTRERRSGYGRAQLMRLHGGSGDRRWRRAFASTWLWGALLPLFALGIGVRWPPALWLTALAYCVLFCRITSRMARRGMRAPDAALYAAGRVVGKFPQMHGALSFLTEGIRTTRTDRPERSSSRLAESIRVTYVVNQYPKVTHTFVRTEIAAVERAGVKVDRVAIRHADSPLVDSVDREEAKRTRVLLDGGSLALITALAHTAATSPRRFAQALRMALRIGWRSERGVAVHLAYLAEACVLLRWSSAQRSQHVHATFGSHTATLALLCRLLGGPLYSFTAHGPEELERAGPLRIAEKAQHAAFVVVVSEAGRAHLQQCCPPSVWERIHLVRCGVDARFATHPPTTVPAARRIVFVGRLCAEKAPLLLVEAMARLKAAGEVCDLVMIGDGPLRDSVESCIRSRGLSNCVTLLGWASSDDVKRHILASRALVLPSFAEGLPIVLMEALALHRPVICTPVGGVAELVEPAVSGWLVPPGSVKALAEAIIEVLNTPPSDLERMGRTGAARVTQLHDPAVAGRRLAALFARGQADEFLPPHCSTSSSCAGDQR